jgi:hypothetical protein
MSRKTTLLDVLIGAVMKLNPRNGERQNVNAFIESCYCGRVRSYNFEAALASLSKLSDEEHHALIEHAMRLG